MNSFASLEIADYVYFGISLEGFFYGSRSVLVQLLGVIAKVPIHRTLYWFIRHVFIPWIKERNQLQDCFLCSMRPIYFISCFHCHGHGKFRDGTVDSSFLSYHSANELNRSEAIMRGRISFILLQSQQTVAATLFPSQS